MELYISTMPGSGTKALGSLLGGLQTAPAGLDHDYVFSGKTSLVVDPRQGSKFDPWWIIGQTCDDLAAYYRSIIEKRFGISLLKPSWDSHISVVKGEEPIIHKTDWETFHGMELDFLYTHEVFTNGYYWWVRVDSPSLEGVRTHFGFVRSGTYQDGILVRKPFHLTVGKTHPRDITVK